MKKNKKDLDHNIDLDYWISEYDAGRITLPVDPATQLEMGDLYNAFMRHVHLS